MKYIIHKNHTNNSVLVTVPSGELSIEEVLIKDCPQGAFIVDKSDLPNFDEFFDAWELNNKTVSVNINKAKEIWKNKIRLSRTSAFEILDAEYMIALEKNISTTEIVTTKQILRDLPLQVDSALTLDEIKSVWNILLGNK